jgi:hypothetical protein
LSPVVELLIARFGRAAYALAGKMDEAKAELAEARRLNPTASPNCCGRTSSPQSLVVSRVVRPHGQRHDPRLIGCKRRGLKQIRFIDSQAQDALPSVLTPTVLKTLRQFAGRRVRFNAFHGVGLVRG